MSIQTKNGQKDGLERRLQFCDYFKNVIVETQTIFNFSYIRLPYETSQRHWSRKGRQHEPKQAIIIKIVFLKVLGCLHKIVSRLFERLKVLWTPHMLG